MATSWGYKASQGTFSSFFLPITWTIFRPQSHFDISIHFTLVSYNTNWKAKTDVILDLNNSVINRLWYSFVKPL